MENIYIHRSGMETNADCARRYYLNYQHAGTGIVPQLNPNYFDLGAGVHVGLAETLMEHGEERAVEEAIAAYRACPSYQHRMYEEIQESERLIEALLRAWCRNGLPQFLAMYKVLHVEAGVHIPQTVFDSSSNFWVCLHWLSRPDAIVRERYAPITGGVSWKTIDDPTDFRRHQFHNDLQGLLESYFGTLFLNSPDPTWTADQLAAYIDDPSRLHGGRSVDYIQTIFLTKGKREYTPEDERTEDSDTGFRRTINSLIYPWILPSSSKEVPFFHGMDVEPNIAWNYRYYRPGLKSYNNLSSFQRSPLLSSNQLQQFITNLSANRIFPTPEYFNGQTALDNTIVWEPPIPRADNHAASAVRQIYFEALRIASALRQNKADFPLYLDANWPQNRKACTTGAWCFYRQLCFTNPLGASHEVPVGFIPRVPHHDAERKALGS